MNCCCKTVEWLDQFGRPGKFEKVSKYEKNARNLIKTVQSLTGQLVANKFVF